MLPRLSALLLTTIVATRVLTPNNSVSSSSAERAHQYPWSEWVTLNDGQSDGLQFSFRKGDNDFTERGMVFTRVYNRYRKTVSATVTFTIVDAGSGATAGGQEMPLYQKPGLNEDEGSWFSTPGPNNESPDRWASARFNLRDIRVKELRLVDDPQEP